jgi:hypothetical protein
MIEQLRDASRRQPARPRELGTRDVALLEPAEYVVALGEQPSSRALNVLELGAQQSKPPHLNARVDTHAQIVRDRPVRVSESAMS